MRKQKQKQPNEEGDVTETEVMDGNRGKDIAKKGSEER